MSEGPAQGSALVEYDAPAPSTLEQVMLAMIEPLRQQHGGVPESPILTLERLIVRYNESTSRRAEEDRARDLMAKLPQLPRPAPKRIPMPVTRPSVTHEFRIDGQQGFATVGLYPDGSPGEVFITMAKEGSTLAGFAGAVGILASFCLQYGIPLEALVRKFKDYRFEPQGATENPTIPWASSILDYIFRYLGIEHVPGFREEQGRARVELKAQVPVAGETAKAAPPRRPNGVSTGVTCRACGGLCVRTGTCYTCSACGEPQGGCS